MATPRKIPIRAAERGLIYRVDRLDKQFSAGVERARLPEALRLVAHYYSEAGERLPWVLGALAAVASRDHGQRPAWRRANRAVVTGWLLDRAIMHLVGRDRPPTPLVEKAGKRDSPSFPSSHTTTAFAMACAYSPLMPRVPLYPIAVSQRQRGSWPTCTTPRIWWPGSSSA